MKRLIPAACGLASVLAAGSGAAQPEKPAAAAALCAASALRLEASFQGATGAAAGFVRLTNIRARACSLRGRPAIRVFSGRGALLPTRQIVLSLTQVPGARAVSIIRRRQSAFVHVVWRNWCGKWPGGTTRLPLPLRLELGLRPGAGRARTAFTSPRPRCEKRSAASTVAVGRYSNT